MAGPTFTGVPLAPTAAANTNTTQIATTAFVMGQVSALGSAASGSTGALSTNIPILGTGGISGSNLCSGDNAGAIICTGMTSSIISGSVSDETGSGSLVFSASPTFTGVPLAPTAATNTNTTQIATTAFVMGQADLLSPLAGSTSITTLGTITSGTWNGAAIAIANGGTGSTTASAARSALGLGTSATANTGGSITNIPVFGANATTGSMCTYDLTLGFICNTAIPSSPWATSGSIAYYTNGNVGIGTTAPAGLLDVNGKLTVLSGGNVGVGTTNPTGTFVVDGGTAAVGAAGIGIILNAQSAINSGGYSNSTNGGNIALTAGNAYSSGTPGVISLKSGYYSNSPTASSLTLNGGNTLGGAGSIILSGGQGQNGYGSAGVFNIESTSTVKGGIISIAGGAATAGNNNGGNILLDGGALSGTGVNGNILIGSVRGNVGIGTTAPRRALDVSGGSLVTKAAILNATSTIDWALGNLQYTASNCGAFQFNNMTDGGSYMFSIQGTTSTTCTFTAYSDAGVTALTVHMPPDNSATIATKMTIYNMVVIGTHVFVSWTPGY